MTSCGLLREVWTKSRGMPKVEVPDTSSLIFGLILLWFKVHDPSVELVIYSAVSLKQSTV
jgi:hypothetical protein